MEEIIKGVLITLGLILLRKGKKQWKRRNTNKKEQEPGAKCFRYI